MTDQPPDWVTKVPPTDAVHTIPASAAGQPGAGTGQTQLLGLCSQLISAFPLLSGFLALGGGSNQNGLAGGVLAGTQSFADSLCGFATGTTSPGTTPQTVLNGVQNTNNAVNNNAFASGVVSMGQAGGSSGNQFIDAINGIQQLFGSLCGIATGSSDVSATTPQTVVDSAQAMTSAGNLLLAGTMNPVATGADLFSAGANALNQNTANHVGHTSLTTAQSVALKAQNLLVSNDFANNYTVAAQAHWSWDGTDGDDALGCARADCDGTQDSLVSNEIPVVAGETIEVACRVKWESLVYSGADPIVLAVEKYRQMKAPNGSAGVVFGDLGWYDIASIAAPGSDSGGFVDLAGSYVVEPGVDQLRFRFDPKTSITGGVVKWDNAEFLKVDLIADDCVPGVGMTVDDIVRQLYGASGEGFTHNESAVALGNTASSLTSVSARLAALEAEGHGGSIAGDDFNWAGEIIASPNWGGQYIVHDSNLLVPQGVYSADGADAVWQPAAGWSEECQFDWQGTGATSMTDYQLVQLVLDSTFDTSGGESYIYLFGRIASGWSSWVRAAIGASGDWSIGYYSGGAFHSLGSGTATAPGLGSTLSLYCGDKPSAAARRFRLQIGSLTIGDVTETGTSSPLGSSNRKWGWGANAPGGLWFFQSSPPKVNQWLAVDQ